MTYIGETDIDKRVPVYGLQYTWICWGFPIVVFEAQSRLSPRIARFTNIEMTIGRIIK
jgi:hypothetical protein